MDGRSRSKPGPPAPHESQKNRVLSGTRPPRPSCRCRPCFGSGGSHGSVHLLWPASEDSPYRLRKQATNCGWSRPDKQNPGETRALGQQTPDTAGIASSSSRRRPRTNSPIGDELRALLTEERIERLAERSSTRRGRSDVPLPGDPWRPLQVCRRSRWPGRSAEELGLPHRLLPGVPSLTMSSSISTETKVRSTRRASGSGSGRDRRSSRSAGSFCLDGSACQRAGFTSKRPAASNRSRTSRDARLWSVHRR